MTKYDRCDPTYTADWISISDIGMVFRGEVLTLERYLYLGGDVRCQRTLALATELGLFVDTGYVSPHHPDPEDEELV